MNRQYELDDLKPLISYTAFEIALNDDTSDEGLQKDAECDFHGVPFLNGITNGEFLHAAFEVITEIIKPNAARIELPTYKDAVLASILDGMAENFLDNFGTDSSSEEQAKGILRLYKATHSIDRRESVAELTRDHWEAILETINEAFLLHRDWELYKVGTFALDTKQPHWPTYQEFRKAKVWFLSNC